MISIKKITDVLGRQLNRELRNSWALTFACRSFCLAGGEIKSKAQGHAPSCHWSSRIWQNISCTVSLEIIKVVEMNNNSVQKRSKNIILKCYLFFASILCSERKKNNSTLFKWFSHYFNDNGVSSAHSKQSLLKFWSNQSIRGSKFK